MPPRKPSAPRSASKAASRRDSSTGAGEFSGRERLVVLIGHDVFLLAEHARLLRTALEAAHSEVEVVRFDPSTPVADVLDECRSLGLLQQHKLVIVDEAERFVNEESRPALERYAAAPPESACLLLRASTWRKGNLDKAVEQVGRIIHCSAPDDPGEVIRWAIARARDPWAAAIEPAGAELLVHRIGADLGRIDSELAKLSVWAGESKQITVAAVRELVGFTREEESAFPLQAPAAAGDAAATLAMMDEFIEVSRMDAVFFHYVLADTARKMHSAARVAESGGNIWKAVFPLKIFGDSKDAILSAARRLPPHRLAALFAEAIDRDSRCKSGLAEPRRSAEALAVRFASVLRH